MNDPIVIVGMKRTAMGAMQGVFAQESATSLGACAIKGALEDAGVKPEQVGEVLMGCVLPAGLGQAPARQAAIAAGLPKGVPTTTVNKVCGSGMKTVMMACDTLKVGNVDVVVAGGMESMSNAPYLLSQARAGYRLGHGEVLDHMFLDGLQDAYEKQLMGTYADATAEKYGFAREEQDAFALESLSRANKAIEEGAYRREITAYTVKSRKGETVIDQDENPGKAKPEKIPSLRPAFNKDGTVTAANASSIADGAAALVLCKKSYAEANGLNIVAAVEGYTQHAHEPEWFTTAPVGAMKNLLEQVNWPASEVDLFEINEAFAVVTLAAVKELGLDSAKVNVNGGACALGHPLGASGARILVTLLSAMENQNKKNGVASLCIGGGEAVAMAVSRL